MSKDGRYFLVELSLREAFEEITTGVFEYTWLNYKHAGDICFNYFHLNNIIKLSTLSMIDINIITNIIPKYNGAIDFEKYLLFVFTNPALSSSSVNSSF